MKEQIEITTTRKIQMNEITEQLREIVRRRGLREGICIVYCPHTTAGLAINENADPDVCSDLEKAFEKIVPRCDSITWKETLQLTFSPVSPDLPCIFWLRIRTCSWDAGRESFAANLTALVSVDCGFTSRINSFQRLPKKGIGPALVPTALHAQPRISPTPDLR